MKRDHYACLEHVPLSSGCDVRAAITMPLLVVETAPRVEVCVGVRTHGRTRAGMCEISAPSVSHHPRRCLAESSAHTAHACNETDKASSISRCNEFATVQKFMHKMIQYIVNQTLKWQESVTYLPMLLTTRLFSRIKSAFSFAAAA